MNPPGPNPPIQRVELAGVPLTVLTQRQLVDRLVELSAGPAVATVAYLNAHVFNLAWSDATFRATLAGFTLVWPDGVSGRFACRLAGGRPRERLSGQNFFDSLTGRLAAAGRRQFLLGGRPGEIDLAAKRLAERHGGDAIAGFHHGYFDASDSPRVVELINGSSADVLTVGMGSTRQERWIAAHASHLAPRLLWTVGALFDVIAGREPAAPAWLRSSGLEWLWRLAHDPAGKFRRYVIGNPLFVWRMLVGRPRSEKGSTR